MGKLFKANVNKKKTHTQKKKMSENWRLKKLKCIKEAIYQKDEVVVSELPYVENSFEKSSSKLTKCRTNGVRISGTSINKFGFVFVTYLLPSQRALLPIFSVPSTALRDHSWPCGFTQKAFIPGYHHLNRASLFRVTSVPLPQNSSLLVRCLREEPSLPLWLCENAIPLPQG